MRRSLLATFCVAFIFWTSTSSADCIDVVRDFKAVCDGAHDDSGELQAAAIAAETIVGNNSVACVSVPPGRTCAYSRSLVLLNFEQKFGPGSLSLFSSGGGNTMYGGGILLYTGGGNAVEIDPSGVGQGLAFNMYGLTLECQPQCGALINIGKTFGPIMIHDNYLEGLHNNISGLGSGGAADGIVCNNCAIQVQIKDNHIFNMSHSAVTVLRGTNITVSGNQLFDAPYGVYLAGAGPVSINQNYLEQIEDGVKLSNDRYWTYNLIDIYDNEFNLEKLPPFFGGANTGDQRCLLIANDASTLSMGAKVHFHDNKCDESDGYVFGNAGLAPYGVELRLTNAGFFTVDLDVENNIFAGMTTSAIYSNSSKANVSYGKNYASSNYKPDGYGTPIPEFLGAQSHSLTGAGHSFVRYPPVEQRSATRVDDDTESAGDATAPSTRCKDQNAHCERPQ